VLFHLNAKPHCSGFCFYAQPVEGHDFPAEEIIEILCQIGASDLVLNEMQCSKKAPAK